MFEAGKVQASRLGLVKFCNFSPSASPSLQKNFDRLNGLLNDFGRDERTSTLKRSTTPAVATCTAIYTFKAQSPRLVDHLRSCFYPDFTL